MKKAVVLEIKDEYAAVLTEEGLVKKIPDRNYTVGQEIDAEEKAGKLPVRWYRAAAAAAAVAMLSGGSLCYARDNVMAYSTVTVTTENGSVELTLNRKDEVVSAKKGEGTEKTGEEDFHVSAMRRRALESMIAEITEGREQAEVSVVSKNTERRERLQEEVEGMLPPEARERTAQMQRPEENVRPNAQPGGNIDGNAAPDQDGGNMQPVNGDPGDMWGKPDPVEEVPGITGENPAPVEEAPGITGESPAPVEEAPGITGESPAPVEETHGMTGENPAPVEENPGRMGENPAPMPGDAGTMGGPGPMGGSPAPMTGEPGPAGGTGPMMQSS